MTHKKDVIEPLEQMPDDRIRKVRHDAECACANARHAEWSKMALAQFAAHYGVDEVEYTADDLKHDVS